MNCVRCRRELPDDSLFCNYCGKKQITALPAQRKKRRRPQGSGSVYKLTGNRRKPWTAQLGGRRLGYWATSGEAILFLDTILAARLPQDKMLYTVGDVWASYKNTQGYERLSKSGKEGLAAAWNRVEQISDQLAVKVSIADYQQIIDTAVKAVKFKEMTDEELAEKKPSERERYYRLKNQPPEPLGWDGKNRIKQLVSHLYEEMRRLGIATENQADLLELGKSEASKKRNFTSLEKKLLKQHDDDDTVKIILIYIDCGFRLNELLLLPRSAVDIKNRVIVGGSKSEAGRDRTVPIPATAFHYIKYFYDQGGEYLIEREGAPISDNYFRKSMFYPKLDEIGIQRQEDGKNVITPHRTRHTFTASAVKAGVAPEALKEIVGHAKYSTTVEKYADDLDLDYLRAEMDKIGH